jgi:hypothetical protein
MKPLVPYKWGYQHPITLEMGHAIRLPPAKPRDWCNCNAILFLCQCEKREAASIGDEREAERLSNEIASTVYAHETGRCRFEYDPDEQPIGVTDDGLG